MNSQPVLTKCWDLGFKFPIINFSVSIHNLSRKICDTLRIDCWSHPCWDSFPASLGSGWAKFCPQTVKIMACNSGRLNPLYSTVPLFITHQPPPLCFSLFLFLSLPFPPSVPPTTSTVPCPALLESEALYGEFITTAAIVQPSLVHLGPGLAQGFNVRLTCVWLEGLKSSSSVPTRWCHHTITSLPLTSLFISRQPASPNPTPISDSCAHIPAGLHARAVKWDTGEERREERSPVWSWPSL